MVPVVDPSAHPDFFRKIIEQSVYMWCAVDRDLTLTYASAGHNPPRLIRHTGALVALNRAQRLPLGIKPDEVYPEQTVQLHTGDRAVFFTDGVIEAVNGEGDVFGSDRIDSALASGPPSAEHVIQSILRELTAFTAGTPVADDRTLVVVKRV